MTFEKYIAIDWSGAQKTPTEKIQIAEYDPTSHTVSIVPSPTQSATGWNKWRREEVFQYVQRQIRERRVLIGFDFAFAYPYCDRNAYFPCHDASPTDAQRLWETVEQVCSPARSDRDLYGGKFYREKGSPFRDFYLYKDFTGVRYKKRYRETDRQAKDLEGLNLDPSSVFICDYTKNVGTGSLAGMRFLHKICREEIPAYIWPFDGADKHRSTLVEIYPSLFRSHAESIRRDQSLPNTVRGLLRCYGATPSGACEKWSDDERDALVSAAGMGYFDGQPTTWQAPTRAAKREGWIFGVR